MTGHGIGGCAATAAGLSLRALLRERTETPEARAARRRAEAAYYGALLRHQRQILARLRRR